MELLPNAGQILKGKLLFVLSEDRRIHPENISLKNRRKKWR